MRGKVPPVAAVLLCVLLAAIAWRATPPFQNPRSATKSIDTAGMPCGSAALLVLAANRGEDTSARLRAVLKENGRLSQPISTFADLTDWAHRAGLELTGLHVEAQVSEHLPFPWIAHLASGHFVVVHAMPPGRVLITDQWSHCRPMPRQEFDRSFSGNVLCSAEVARRAGPSLLRR